MNLKAALLATAACAFLLAACGGGGGSGSDASQLQPGSGGGSDPGASTSGGGTSASGGGSSGTGSSCQPQTVVGGELFVAQQGPVGVTLLSDAGLSQYTLDFFYDNVFGIPTNNQQDKWGQVAPLPFPPGTPVGTSIQVQLQPFTGFVHGEQTPSTFPKGIPVELSLHTNDGNGPGPGNISSTAPIGKDIPHSSSPTASVTYGANGTATVTFFSTGGPAFSVGLTNVSGKGSPTGC